MKGQPRELVLSSAGQELARVRAAAVVFDCDGLLMDSERPWLRMLNHWVDGTTLSVDSLHGESFTGAAQKLLTHVEPSVLPSADITGLADWLSSRYSQLLRGGVTPMPHAVATISALSAELPSAVASNGRRADVEHMLRHAGVLDRIDVLCTIDDVVAGKPAPDLYLSAVTQLGADPTQSVAFEDSAVGTQAAIAAGLTVVGVNRDSTVDMGAHYHLFSLDQVSLT